MNRFDVLLHGLIIITCAAGFLVALWTVIQKLNRPSPRHRALIGQGICPVCETTKIEAQATICLDCWLQQQV